ncbi:hypothetical protein MKY14_02565 [Paenibacillus sp. FSL R5-0887]|jgi:hypothetical protein|uniref:hypothetical protein n=1 Tax=Paenibacillus TaxID=44249 RepID=UPI00096C1477|nr:hypothetical protein [Paenibacillus odorifer]OMD60753.1 hypothetical protein BSK55_05145 [Paenibacillus odorifer]OMD87408.1 hypothetical protein BSK67_27515 [Paenibacillus odorifer]
MIEKELLRQQTLHTIGVMLDEHLLQKEDMFRFQSDVHDTYSPEYIRSEMENWYRTLGIEYIIQRKFSLRMPQFTREELEEADRRNEIILCVPQGVSRKQLGCLFNIRNWALESELVAATPEVEDFWFTVPRTTEPNMLDRTAVEIQRTYKKTGKLGMSLERYLVFVARMRHLTGQTPDIRTKMWITNGKYEGKAMLVVGFDSAGEFTAHGWMPNFHSPMVGGRYTWIPDHI